MRFKAGLVVPVLRVFDLVKAHEFYVGYLGFTVDWEHRFDGEGPVYQQVSRGSLVLHLSEHHGDGTPGTLVYVYAKGVRDLHAELAGKDYPYLNPGIGPSAGAESGGACLELRDPFGNTLRIDERED
ncbi:glyoxalase/bleomycin resistance/extradiol dioxygenase family protein [Amycolatopsis antarctica]|uniref:Bleomycin resistance protein n=1 Tax=Amycolatopsis antarctica TaxID=1854586 RepID=A0A263D7N2_9PSEU|nr:glyoxalase superfamily protein [Amycolatopsis antarctica]OZM73496.1 glyoxalase/bleomycin resistance/extradiol dioxygenase family protein [Amycolatopsis antarctica]